MADDPPEKANAAPLIYAALNATMAAAHLTLDRDERRQRHHDDDVTRLRREALRYAAARLAQAGAYPAARKLLMQLSDRGEP